jgi:hypothetical protein
MLALYRSGRQAEALDTYRSGRKLLADELGLEPGDELRRLEKAILEQDPAIAAPVAPKRAELTPEERGRRIMNRSRLAVALGALLLAGAVTGVVLALTGGSEAVMVLANSVAVLDPTTGRITADVPIGGETSDGVAVTLEMTGAVASCEGGVRRNAAGWPFTKPSPAIAPWTLTARAPESTQVASAISPLRSVVPSASVYTKARCVKSGRVK